MKKINKPSKSEKNESSQVGLTKYDKAELIETLKKAHQFYYEQLEKELYIDYSTRPDWMLEEPYQKYKVSLEKRLFNARKSLERITEIKYPFYENIFL